MHISKLLYIFVPNQLKQNNMKAKFILYDLYALVKNEGNCKEYVIEMCTQLQMFGTETNTLTRQMVYDEMKKVLEEKGNSLSLKK